MKVDRVAIVMPDLAGGGAERVAVNLANAFVARGYGVDMVLLRAEGQFLEKLDSSIRLVDLGATRIRNAIGPLVRYLRHARPQAVLANMWPLTLIAVWARMLARVPTRLVLAEHTTWSRSELLERSTVHWQIRSSMRFFYQRADAIVTVSEGAANDLAIFADLPRSAIACIYNPVVGSAHSTSRSLSWHSPPSGWWQGGHKRVLAVGTLKPIKDFGTLLSAFAALVEQMDARLLILGEGDSRPMLEAQVRHLGLGERVFMPGFAKDVAPYYERADLHVLSSTGEGFGNVIVEALAAGTPVVSTDCQSGPREILCDGKFGRLVPVGDVSELAKAMNAALSSSHDPVALQARAQDFTIANAADRYVELLFPAALTAKSR